MINMAYNKIKNGHRIVVEKWGKVITITNIDSGKVICVSEFSDHIRAMQVAQSI